MPKPKAKRSPQFDAEPLHDDDFEGACPIPDEDGEVVLHRSKTTKEGPKRGRKKGSDKKPS